MRRRTFLATVSGGLLTAPLAAAAQPTGKVARIGWLSFGPAAGSETPAEFFGRLEELGYVRGRTLIVESRVHHDQAELPSLARELLQLGVDLIVANGTVAAQAAKSVTSTTPIVFLVSGDPIGAGLVTSLARPGGNATGPSTLSAEFAPKRIELFKAAIPRLNRIGVLGTGTGISAKGARDIEAAALVAGVKVRRLTASAEDLEGVFGVIRKESLDGLVVVNSPEFIAVRAQLAALTLRARLPSMFEEWRFVESGGLMAYGPSYPEIFRRAAVYVDKILKGAKPGDLPVEQPTKFDLVINLKTAKALGLTIPPSLLARADQVIE